MTTRQDVLTAALLWLDGRDPAGVELREIARALDMSPTSVYRYFDSMHDLRTALGMQQPPPPVPAGFTDQFIERAVSPDRIRSVIADLLGTSLVIGPLAVGPGKRGRAVARGVVGEITTTRAAGGLAARIPVGLVIDIEVGRFQKRISAKVVVPIGITARVTDELALFIDVVRPHPRTIAVDVDALGLSAVVVRKVGRVDNLVRANTLAHIDAVLASPEGKAATTIDIGQMIDDAWAAGVVFERRAM